MEADVRMTDLEITKLCAEAMELSVVEDGPQSEAPTGWMVETLLSWMPYDPLHDDAQAMALVKRFGLAIKDSGVWSPAHKDYVEGWFVARRDKDDVEVWGESTDLNRAICKCVAKMKIDSVMKGMK